MFRTRLLRLDERDPMRSPRRAAAIFLVALSTTASACATPAWWPQPPAPADPAAAPRSAAANWLISRFDPTSKLIPSEFVPGAADPGGSAYAVTSLKLAGVGGATASDAVAALAPLVNVHAQDNAGADKPGALARLILAVRSTGGNPRSFGGTDLVARLEATVVTSGPNAGRFGVQDATYDGAFRQGLALAALSTISPRPATITPGAGGVNALPAVAWLRSQQCSDGSWMPSRANLDVPCAPDPVTFASPDSNSTALAVLGLRAVNAAGAQSAGAWFTSVRELDGGWAFDASPFSSTDPDSTGLVMAALRALGTPPDVNARAALLGFQFGAGAAAADQGAFYYPPFSGPPVPNVLATNDAILGLASGVWPANLVS